jgi:hypothetical protein
MATVVKKKDYVNRQATYADAYTIWYRREDDGTYTLWAHNWPNDPFHNVDESHLGGSTPAGAEVCIAPGKEPRSLERAEAIAHTWMLGYSEYVRTGKFPKGTRRVSV